MIDPGIAKHHGRTVKLMGDGLLAEFPSVVEAINCAAEIQRAMAARNAGLFQGRREMAFRIGVHLGDVIVEEGDLYGDGVNIAARLRNRCEGVWQITRASKYHLGGRQLLFLGSVKIETSNGSRFAEHFCLEYDKLGPRSAVGS